MISPLHFPSGPSVKADPAAAWHLQPPTLSEIISAQTPHLVRTPLIESPRVNAFLGGRLLVKAEGLQVTGSFKARGALNMLANLSEADRRRGVITYSSGNHAQAVAWAAARLGISALILMPSTAPTVKLERTRALGAVVEQVDWEAVKPQALCARIALERDLIMVPPFEDRRILAGAATLGVEMIEQADELDAAPLDAVLAGCSGGGLLAGTALAFNALSPKTEVWGVEPAGFDDLAQSLIQGKRISNPPGPRTICDSLSARTTGELTFDILRQTIAGALAVTDEEVLRAMRFAFEEFRIVLEPGAAASLAAVLTGRCPAKRRTVAVIASGANVDPEMAIRALQTEPFIHEGNTLTAMETLQNTPGLKK